MKALLSAAVFAVSLCMPAIAQPAAGAPDPAPRDIVVSGTRKQELIERAAAFVRLSNVSGGIRALARWRQGVCPNVYGGTLEEEGLIERRIRAIAKAVNAPVAGIYCQPNITITLTRDPPALVCTILASSPFELGEATLAQRARVRTGDDPIRWWYATDVEGAHGSGLTDNPPAASIEAGAGSAAGFSVGGLGGGGHHSLGLYSSSMIGTQSARALRGATVIINLNRIGSVPPDAIAS